MKIYDMSSRILYQYSINRSVFTQARYDKFHSSWSSLLICMAFTATMTNVADCSNNEINAPRLLRKKTTLERAVDSTKTKKEDNGSFLQRLTTREQINSLRSIEDEILLRWERDEDGWRQLPARAWPERQPNPQQLEIIIAEIKKKSCNEIIFDNNTKKNERENSDDDKKSVSQEHCTKLLFDMASSLVFYNVDPKAGFELYNKLAEQGHVDSMVACGIILLEGLQIGVPLNEKDGCAWLEKAIETGSSAQACYELGTVYYTGIDGVVEEDATKAYELFLKASEQQHTAALFMTAECLVEGEGCKKSVAKAIPLFYGAAERGHRFSRQRIRELLAR